MQMTAYNRVAQTLRDQILSGVWEETNRLPTERELCEQLFVSRITIRRALKILEEEQLVETRQGAGTFIKVNSQRKIPLLSTDYFNSIQTHAPDLMRRPMFWQLGKASQEVAAALNITTGEQIMETMRIDSLRGEPIATDHIFFPEPFANRLKSDDLEQVNFLSRWSRVQRIEMDYCTQTIEATRARKPISELLEVSGGTILLKEKNIVYVKGNRAAGLFITHYRHDIFHFESTIDLKSRGFGRRNRE